MDQKIKALVGTIAKKEPIDSMNLEANRMKQIRAGWVCPIRSSQLAENNHVKVNLGFDAGVWYFYKPHVHIYEANTSHGSLADKVVHCCEERDFPLMREAGEINIVAIEGMDPEGQLNPDRNDHWNDTVGVLQGYFILTTVGQTKRSYE